MTNGQNDNLKAALEAAERKFGGSRVTRLCKQPVRSILPLMDRRLGRERPVSIETYFGETFHGVLPEAVSTQVWRSSYFAPDVCRAIMHVLKAGDQFVDIGSHFGFYSLLGGRIVGPSGLTLSVEAMPKTYEYLTRNLAKFVARGTARLHQGAAFDRQTKLKFKDFGIVASSLNTAYENRGCSNLVQTPVEVDVTAMPTDVILATAGLTAPDVIKIDAESAELYVLKGLTGTIERHRPALIIEIGDDPKNSNPSSLSIFKMLSEYGYKAETFHGSKLQNFYFDGPIPYANVLFTA